MQKSKYYILLLYDAGWSMSFGFWQIVIIIVLALLLFGRGRISDLMGDVGKGIKSFRKGLKEESDSKTHHHPVSHDHKSSEQTIDVTSDEKDKS